MSAIENLKTEIKENWETFESGKEQVQKQDRKVVRNERKVRNFQILMIYILLLLFFIWVLFFGVLGLSSAPNNDMSPSIKAGDILLYNRIQKAPSQNDVVVFEVNGTRYVGRVVARGGDTVEIVKKGGLKVNEHAIIESNIYEPTLPREGLQNYPLKLDENEYFILADARNDAEDSRYFGGVKKENIKGIVIGMFRRTGI